LREGGSNLRIIGSPIPNSYFLIFTFFRSGGGMKALATWEKRRWASEFSPMRSTAQLRSSALMAWERFSA
jgi:hypothetical protein